MKEAGATLTNRLELGAVGLARYDVEKGVQAVEHLADLRGRQESGELGEADYVALTETSAERERKKVIRESRRGHRVSTKARASCLKFLILKGKIYKDERKRIF